MATVNHVQKELFRQLAAFAPNNRLLAGWLCDLLDIDVSNAYRRIRGEKELSFSEIDQLACAIPVLPALLAAVTKSTQTAFGEVCSFNSWRDLKIYLQSLLNQFSQLARKPHCVRYVARDFPLFIYLSHPRLMKFRFRLLMHAAGNNEQVIISDDVLKISQDLYDCYHSMRREEIWYFYGFLNQIELIRHSLYLDHLQEAEAAELCQLLDQYFAGREEELAGSGPNHARLYITDFCVMNNSMFLEADKKSLLLNGLQAEEFFITRSAPAMKLFDLQWKMHHNFANDVTSGALKLRKRYFKNIRRHIEEVKPNT